MAKKKEIREIIIEALILTFILLVGVGLLFWIVGFIVGFFGQKEPIQIIQREVVREYEKCFKFKCYMIDQEEFCFSQ